MTNSLLAAGLGSTYICADLFGMRPSMAEAKTGNAARTQASGRAPPGHRKRHRRAANASFTDDEPNQALPRNQQRARLDGEELQDRHRRQCFYYLYGLERYKSFQEMFDSIEDKSPQWYNDGYEFLAKNQGPDGSWAATAVRNATRPFPCCSCSAPRKKASVRSWAKACCWPAAACRRIFLAPSSAMASSSSTRSTPKSTSYSR